VIQTFKYILSFFFTCCIFSNFIAQVTYIIEEDSENFYCENGIEIDSCNYHLLYDEAYNWMNTPYKYAGNSKNGIDCSSLIKNIYSKIYNLKLSGSSSYIYAQTKEISDKNELKEGDLLFFKINKKQISHIGIFLKDGYFIHSSVNKGVTISNLNEKYYQKYYFTAGRIQ
jgi:lipoprotein Spr